MLMFCHLGGAFGPCPPFSECATTGAVVALARPDDDDAVWKAPFQREHSAAEHAGYPGAVGQHLGQPVVGARVDSWVTHNGYGSRVRWQSAERQCARQFPG